MIITATQLKVQGIGGWFQFYSRIGNINRQLRSAEGLVFSKVKGLKTLTGWKSHEAKKKLQTLDFS